MPPADWTGLHGPTNIKPLEILEWEEYSRTRVRDLRRVETSCELREKPGSLLFAPRGRIRVGN
jgi:hypothetical protein